MAEQLIKDLLAWEEPKSEDAQAFDNRVESLDPSQVGVVFVHVVVSLLQLSDKELHSFFSLMDTRNEAKLGMVLNWIRLHPSESSNVRSG